MPASSSVSLTLSEVLQTHWPPDQGGVECIIHGIRTLGCDVFKIEFTWALEPRTFRSPAWLLDGNNYGRKGLISIQGSGRFCPCLSGSIGWSRMLRWWKPGTGRFLQFMVGRKEGEGRGLGTMSSLPSNSPSPSRGPLPPARPPHLTPKLLKIASPPGANAPNSGPWVMFHNQTIIQAALKVGSILQ